MRKKTINIIRRAKPEYKFNSELIAKFVCQIMLDGKKTIALKLVYKFLDKVIIFESLNQNINIIKIKKDNSLEKVEMNENINNSIMLKEFAIQKQINENLEIINPEIYLQNMLEKIYISHFFRARKVGGSTYQIPCPATPRDKLFKAMKLFRNICRVISRKNGMSFDKAMYFEYKNIINKTGECIKFVESKKKMIESNLPYANMFRKRKKILFKK
jgi:ribosomal protein S7